MLYLRNSHSLAGQYFTAIHCISVSKSRHSPAVETEMKFKVAAAHFREKSSLPTYVHRKHCLFCVSHKGLDKCRIRLFLRSLKTLHSSIFLDKEPLDTVNYPLEKPEPPHFPGIDLAPAVTSAPGCISATPWALAPLGEAPFLPQRIRRAGSLTRPWRPSAGHPLPPVSTDLLHQLSFVPQHVSHSIVRV